MESKKQKIKKQKIKNSFIDLKIIFKFDYWYIHSLSEEQIENIHRFIRFYNKPLCQKEEILLNDYLKKELRKVIELKKIEERLKLVVDSEDVNYLEYYEKENILEKIGYKRGSSTASLKRITKKNCDTDENKFSIKILKTTSITIQIGLRTIPNKSNTSYWKIFYYTGFDAKEGSIIRYKYDSKKGYIEGSINNELKKMKPDILNFENDYMFSVSLFNIGDKIQIIE